MVNTNQKITWVTNRHSKMVGAVLDQIEAALPEGVQCEKVKKLVQGHLYDFRKDMYNMVYENVDFDEGN